MIGTTLQQLITEKGTNVNELAKKIKISPQTLYSIIKRDNMKIDFDVLLRICDALDVEVEVFYKDYIENKKPSFLSHEATEVAQAYERATIKEKNTVRQVLDLKPLEPLAKEVSSSDDRKFAV